MREGERHVNIIEPLVTLPLPLFINVPVVRDTKEQKVRNDRRDFATGRSAQVLCRKVVRRDDSPVFSLAWNYKSYDF